MWTEYKWFKYRQVEGGYILRLPSGISSKILEADEPTIKAMIDGLAK